MLLTTALLCGATAIGASRGFAPEVQPAPLAAAGQARGVDATATDPAAVAMTDGLELQVRQGWERGETSARLGVAGAMPVGPLGLAASWEHAGDLGLSRWSVGLAWRPLDGLAVGAVYRAYGSDSDGDDTESTAAPARAALHDRVGTWDMSVLAEPSAWLSLSLGVEALNTPRLAGARLRRAVRTGIALRPVLGAPWLTLGYETRLSYRDGDLELARQRTTLDVAVWRGLHGLAAVDWQDAETRVWGGLSVSFGHAEAVVAAADGAFAAAQTVRHAARPSVLPRRERRVSLPLTGTLSGERASLLDTPRAISLATLRLRELAEADDVDTVVLPIDRLHVGLATVDELRTAITRLRAAGKRVEAELNGADEKAYMIAAACDVIRMDPLATVSLDGFAISVPYFGAALSKFGVRFEAVAIGRYKSGADPLTRSEPRAEDREVLTAMLSEAAAALAQAMRRQGKVTAEQADAALALGTLTAAEALRLGLVDELTRPADPAVPESDEPTVQPPIWRRRAPEPRPWGRRPVVAVVPIQGTIVVAAADNPLPGRSVEAASIVAALERAARDGAVVAVVLRIDSPGGDVMAAEQIWRAVRRVAAKKPVVASLGDIAASGGYYVALPAHAIFAEPSTVTGSIGIFSLRPDLSGLLDKLDLHVETYKTGEHADWQSPTRPLSDGERERAEQVLRTYYDAFVARVAAGRAMAPATAETAAQGRVYTGIQAQPLHLVDHLGGLMDALDEAKRRAGLRSDDRVNLDIPAEPSVLSQMLARLASANAQAAGASAGASTQPRLVREAMRTIRRIGSRAWAMLPLASEVMP